MGKQVYYKVRAIEGKLCIHPDSVGTGSIHMIGHEKYTSDAKEDLRYPFGLPVPTTKYRLREGDGAVEVVRETDDGYFGQRFRHGDLAYLATVEQHAADSPERVDPVLKKLSDEACAACDAKAVAESAAERDTLDCLAKYGVPTAPVADKAADKPEPDKPADKPVVVASDPAAAPTKRRTGVTPPDGS